MSLSNRHLTVLDIDVLGPTQPFCTGWLAVCLFLDANLAEADFQVGEKLAGAWRYVRMQLYTKQEGVS